MHLCLVLLLAANLPVLAPAVLGVENDLPLPFDPAEVVRQVSATTDDSTAFLLDTNTVYTASAQAQSYARAAFDGEYYLVVWTDHRCSFKDDVYGARLTADGVLLDSAGIPISLEAVNQSRPSVAFDGTDFLVVWSDTRGGYYDIYGARVTHDGEVLEPHGFAVHTDTDLQQFPSVAVFDTLCLVTWQDSRSGYWDIYGARVSGGQVLDPGGFQVSYGAENEQYGAISPGADGWLVVWQDSRNGGFDIYGSRVTPDGKVADSAGIWIARGSHNESNAAVGFDSLWLVSWADMRGGTYSDIYAARVGSDGSVLDTLGFAVSTAGNSQSSPSVSGSGSFMVSWGDARSYPDYNIYGTRVTRAGVVLDPSGLAVSTAGGSQQTPMVAWGDTNWLVSWNDGRGDNSWAVYSARVGTGGTVIDPDGIHTSPLLYNQFEPDVAFDGTNYLVAWGDYRSGTNRDIYGTRVAPDGTVLDPAGIPLCTQGNWQGVASVEFGDSLYLVAWGDLRTGFDIYGTRVTPAGEVLDPGSITICRYEQIQLYPDISWTGDHWLVVWHDWRNHEYDIYGTRVTEAGTVLDPSSLPICTGNRNEYHPVVATADSTSLVTWDDTRDGSSRIYGTRVNKDGEVLEPGGFRVSSASAYRPAIGFDGDNYLVTWDDYRAAGANIYGARVAPDGTILDPTGKPISTAVNSQEQSAVAFDGGNWFVSWQDWRNGHDYDIYAAKVSPAGTVLETFPVRTGPEEHISPAVAAGADGQVLLTWSGWTDSINSRVGFTQRIWGWLYPGTSGAGEGSRTPNSPRTTLEAYPNPFSRSITLRLASGVKRSASVSIFDTGGRLVRTLLASSPGRQACSVIWDGRDDYGRTLPDGVYHARLGSVDGSVQSGSITLVR